MVTHPIKPGVVTVLPVRLHGPIGRVMVHAIIDTGATYTMFPPPTLAAIGLEPSNERTVKIITASSVEFVPVLKLAAIDLLGAKIENLEVVSHYLPPGMPAQGLIGVNAFRDCRIAFDYPQKVFSLER